MAFSRLGFGVWAGGALAAACVCSAPAAAAGCGDEGVREKQAHGLQLPDCRAYEQVSPPDKNDVDARGFPGAVQASPSGGLARYYAVTPFPPAVPGSCAIGGAKPSYISSRQAGGEWASEGILPCEAVSGGKVGVSEDLSEALVWAEGAALSADAPATGRSYYIRYTQPREGKRYRLLAAVNTAGLGEEEYDIYLAGFSGDDQHMLFETAADLLPGASVGSPNVYEADLAAPEGQGLSLVGVLPAEEGGKAPTGGSVAGAGTRPWLSYPSHFPGLVYTQSAVSQDGSRVFFTALPSERVYVRENPGAPPSPTGPHGECTVPADACTLAVSQGAAHFRSATPDGSYAFYTEDKDLYRFDTQTGARETVAAPVTATATGNLESLSSVIEHVEPSPVGIFHAGERITGTGLRPGTRVTAVGPHTLTLNAEAEITMAGVALSGDPAEVLGVLGVSDDGRALYYAASAVLASNANSRGETAASEPNIADLYESYQGAAGPTFIAQLDDPDAEGEGDEEDWNDHLDEGFPVERTARLTSDGQTLLFASRRELSGYDNSGPEETCGDSRRCSELYRYRAGAEGAPGRLTCVSCNPKRSTAPDGDALLTGYGGGVTEHFEVALTRNLSENGQRVFFQTPDALVAGDTNSQTDVYEWEADGEGGCRSEAQDEGCLYLISSGSSSEQSYFGDASASGNDVFFFTRDKLVPTDTDSNVDIYDARVCVKGDNTCEEETLVEPAPCTEECAGPGNAPPALPAPSSSTLSGNGNLTPPAAAPAAKPLTSKQKLAAALKACRAKHDKHRRAACESRARRRYPTRPAARKAAKR